MILKSTKTNLLYFVLLLSVIGACQSDDEQPNPVLNIDVPPNTVTAPCEFDLSSVSANATITVNCVLDLNGNTINLPENVTFDFDGGDIINGKLVFSGGNIDGRLLSAQLEVEGDVQLKDPCFKFYAVRWDIQEGPTTSEIALKNNANLENLMFWTKSLGATTFKIDKFDAYFEVTKVTSTTTNANWYPSLEAVNIPSGFHLQMTENTHLRLFPADQFNRVGGAILAVRDAEDITVTGGNLHGDRDQRVFSADDNGLEGSHLFLIHSGRNIEVDGVHFEDGSSGTFAIYSFGFSYNPNYNPTKNVTIRNCILKNSRRMAIALVDGRDILIEGNTFINAGQPSSNTDGGEVGYAINIEPERFRDENGVLKERQRVFDVMIRGNVETGSRGGFLTLTIGQDITVDDNDIGTRVVYSLVNGVKITNNRFKATGSALDSWAIFCAGSGETVYNNEVANNTIEDYSLGVVIGSIDSYVHHNTITNCGAGIQLSKSLKARIHENVINVTGNGIQSTNTHNDQAEIVGNEISTTGNFNIYFANMNHQEGHQEGSVTIDNNELNTAKATIFSNVHGVIFKNNTVAGGIQVANATNVGILNNVIRSTESDGIRLYETHSSVEVMNNTIYEPTGAERFECINNDSDNPAEITLTNNSCN